jgi:uncharacterized protein
MNHDPLTDRDYQRLGATLARFSEQQCMSLEQLDGFFTGLLCGPMPLKPADCLPMILGDAFDDEQAFPTEQSLDRFAKLLLRHWFDISDTLRDGTAFHPWLDEDESGVVHGNQWAQGFCDAMQLMPEDWALLFEDEQAAVHLEPIMALAFEQEADDEQMRQYLDTAGSEQRQAWLAEITTSVQAIHAFFAGIRQELSQEEVD